MHHSRVCRRLRRVSVYVVLCVLQISMVALGVGFDDMRSAYRRIPTYHPYYTMFAVWDVQRECVVYYYLPGHQFGSIAAVLNFNRFPKPMVRMARVLFAVMVDQYFDDYMTVDTAVGLTSAQDSLILCHDLVGPDLIEYKKQGRWPTATWGSGTRLTSASFIASTPSMSAAPPVPRRGRRPPRRRRLRHRLTRCSR